MNCFTVALYIWLINGCEGRLIVLKWVGLMPHMAVSYGPYIAHYQANDWELPNWKILWYSGRITYFWIGEEK